MTSLCMQVKLVVPYDLPMTSVCMQVKLVVPEGAGRGSVLTYSTHEVSIKRVTKLEI